MDTWARDDAERQALCRDLAGIEASQWDVQSLCAEWKVRHVVAHLVAATGRTAGELLLGVLKHGMKPNRFIAHDALAAGAASPESLLGQLRDTVGTHTAPPMVPPSIMLVDTVCHSMDIRRPLGLHREAPEHTLVAVADTMRKTTLMGTKKRIAGLRFVATDAPWSSGNGPTVEGPLDSLILAMAGRRAALGDLAGEGIGVVASHG